MHIQLTKFLSVTTVLFCHLSLCYSYFVNIDASSEECFFESVTKGSRMTLTYEVADGGFLDIDVIVSDHDHLHWWGDFS